MNASLPPTPSRLLAACGLIVAAVFAAYCNSYQAPFVYDGRVLERDMQPLSWNAPERWFEVWPRPLGFFMFRLQYTLHGRWLPGFHAVNIAIHAAAAVFLFGSVYLTCRLERWPAAVRRDAAAIALAAALLFGLHPLQTQSVTYLYQRFESLMGMFFLASVFCFAMGCRTTCGEGRVIPAASRIAWLVAAWASVVASIASKEVGAAAPLVLLWYDRAFVADSWQALARRRGWFYAPFAVLMMGCVAFLVLFRDHYASGGIFNTVRMPVSTYALHQPYVICRYLGLVVWPRGLCLDWALKPMANSQPLVPALMAVIAALGFTAWSAIRLPWVGFLLGAFFLILAPTSSFAPIVDLAFEHRMYLPLAPLSVLVVMGLRWLAMWAHVRKQAAVATVAGLAIALGILTYRRNEVYESGCRVWTDVIQKAPQNARAYFNLAWHVEEQVGDIPAAIRLYRRAIQLNPSLAAAHRSLAVLLFNADRPQATWHARRAVGLERSADNLSNLGIVIAETDPAEAEACFREALTISPTMAEAQANLAKLLAQKQERKAASKPAEREPAFSSP